MLKFKAFRPLILILGTKSNFNGTEKDFNVYFKQFAILWVCSLFHLSLDLILQLHGSGKMSKYLKNKVSNVENVSSEQWWEDQPNFIATANI